MSLVSRLPQLLCDLCGPSHVLLRGRAASSAPISYLEPSSWPLVAAQRAGLFPSICQDRRHLVLTTHLEGPCRLPFEAPRRVAWFLHPDSLFVAGECHLLAKSPLEHLSWRLLVVQRLHDSPDALECGVLDFKPPYIRHEASKRGPSRLMLRPLLQLRLIL